MQVAWTMETLPLKQPNSARETTKAQKKPWKGSSCASSVIFSRKKIHQNQTQLSLNFKVLIEPFVNSWRWRAGFQAGNEERAAKVIDREKILQGLSKKRPEPATARAVSSEALHVRMLPKGDFLASAKQQLCKNPDLADIFCVRVPRHLRPKKTMAPVNTVRNLILEGLSVVACVSDHLPLPLYEMILIL